MIPIVRNIKRYFSLRELTVVFLALAISVSAGIGVFLLAKKEVIIVENGKQSVVKTMKSTVAEVLQQNDIKVSRHDYVSLPMNTKLQRMNENKIIIKRAVPVKLVADGKEQTVMTYRDTVREVLGTGPVALKEADRLDGINPDDNVIKDMTIKIIRVDEKLVTEKIDVPYNVVRKENMNLAQGTQRVVKSGEKGTREKLYKIIAEDGKEIARELIKDTILKNPINAIVEFGSLMSKKTSRGESLRYNKILNMTATAYTASFKDTGKRPGDPGFGITASGMRVKKGVVAVDPRVIPLGTRLYIELEGSTPDYGFAIAADTGGAIKGNKIDLYFDNLKAGFGYKKAKVYILND